jgi:uncharacterized membrane-anchored protein
MVTTSLGNVTVGSARVWHALTAAVAILALALQLAGDPLREGPVWCPVRLASVVGITVTELREDHSVLGVVLAVGAITASFLLLFALARYVDQRARPAPEAWDPYRGGVAQP